MTTTTHDETRFIRRERINIILHDNALTQQPNRFAVIAAQVREYESTLEPDFSDLPDESFVDPDGPICQDDYEFLTKNGQYSPAQPAPWTAADEARYSLATEEYQGHAAALRAGRQFVTRRRVVEFVELAPQHILS